MLTSIKNKFSGCLLLKLCTVFYCNQLAMFFNNKTPDEKVIERPDVYQVGACR